MTRSRQASIALVLVSLAAAPAQSPLPPGTAYVSLASQQTPFRNQGGRNSCITFAAVAALEAAYKRAGYGSLDLSEEFLSDFVKNFWLDPSIVQPGHSVPSGEDVRENQVAAFGGGGGVGSLQYLSEFLRIPAESVMPYHVDEYKAADHPNLSHAWDDFPFWTQRRVSDVNLSSTFLPDQALHAPQYYSARGFHAITPSVGAIEAALARGREVVIDMTFVFTVRDGINHANPAPAGSHAVLIVGFDRRDPDPQKHYLLIKNSWNDTDFWKLGYDTIPQMSDAAYIDGVNPPQPWPELPILGRWKLEYDGFRGILDIYHLPGAGSTFLRQNGSAVRDQRIGTFYDDRGRAFKVNGSVAPSGSLTFYLDVANPYPRWDVLAGRKFDYHPVSADRQMLAGMHRDGDGSRWGGYLTRQDYVPPATPLRTPVKVESYLGSWAIRLDGRQGSIRLNHRNESVVPAQYARDYFGLTGDMELGGQRGSVTVLIGRASPNSVLIFSPAVLGDGPDGSLLEGRLLSRHAGLVAGNTVTPYHGLLRGFLMTYLSN